MVLLQAQLPMQAQVGVPWHSVGMGAQWSPPPPATPPTSTTQTVPAGQPPVQWGQPPSGIPPSLYVHIRFESFDASLPGIVSEDAASPASFGD